MHKTFPIKLVMHLLLFLSLSYLRKQLTTYNSLLCWSHFHVITTDRISLNTRDEDIFFYEAYKLVYWSNLDLLSSQLAQKGGKMT